MQGAADETDDLEFKNICSCAAIECKKMYDILVEEFLKENVSYKYGEHEIIVSNGLELPKESTDCINIDENRKEHIVYNICPHLKCSLIFNEVEKTWDCPCHASRFDIDGNVIEGPSTYNISYKKDN